MSESGLMEGWGQTPPKERCPIGLLVSAAALDEVHECVYPRDDARR